jgi:taurine dioxygenase
MNQPPEPGNAAAGIEVVKFAAPLGAEIRGVDFAQPVGKAARGILRDAWAENLILLFRGQPHISQRHHIDATEIFGTPVPGAKLKYFEQSGTELVHRAKFPEISVVSNLGPDGAPAMENEGLGSGEVVWHSDNSYIEAPPIGSFLRAQEVPPDGGNTSFNNQYLAYETLPADIKQRIQGLYTKQDLSRNSAGRLRPGLNRPETLEDVEGPDHPLVRIHPETGKKALYLGRRRVFPSQYIIGWEREQSEELLDFLWRHATGDNLKYTHVWAAGDMILWDNRCVMHYRAPMTTLARRIMHRTQIEHQKPIPA